MIQKKPIHTAPPRLQRMLPRLQKYDYNIVYRPGKEMTLADRLSRFPSRSENLPIELHHNIQHITFTSDKTNIIRGATERDPILYTVYRITHNGWPSRFHEVPRIAHQYWGARDEINHRQRLTTEKVREFVYLLNYIKEHSMIYTKDTKVLKKCNTLRGRKSIGQD